MLRVHESPFGRALHSQIIFALPGRPIGSRTYLFFRASWWRWQWCRSSEPLWALALAFVAICLIVSANSPINEFLDGKYDRFHPTKSSRPGALGVLDWRLVLAQYVGFAAAGIAMATAINRPFLLSALALLAMGLIYNVPPIRTKDHAYLDVLSSICKQSYSLSPGLVRDNFRLFPAIERPPGVLDGRRLPDGC